MKFGRVLQPSNRRVRLMVGLLLAGFFCIQCTRTEAFKPSDSVMAVNGQVVGEVSNSQQQRLIDLAKTDHIALLEHCLANYQASYRDYTCTFVKQERINNRVGKEQVIHVKFREEPFSVAMAWTPQTAPRGDRVLFVEGKHGNSAPRACWAIWWVPSNAPPTAPKPCRAPCGL